MKRITIKSKEPDDFANDKEIQKARKEIKEMEQMVSQSIALICREFSMRHSFPPPLESFLISNSLEDASVTNSYRSTKAEYPISLLSVEYCSVARMGKYSSQGHDFYFFGLIEMAKEFPLTYISRETIREKLVDLFVKGDTDFPGSKKFSSAFHVVTRDKDKLRILLLNKALDELLAFPDMEAELNGNTCMFRVSRNPVSQKEAGKFVTLARIMTKLFR
jgi:hypothetical protein